MTIQVTLNANFANKCDDVFETLSARFPEYPVIVAVAGPTMNATHVMRAPRHILYAADVVTSVLFSND